MGDAFEISGGSLSSLFYASQLATLLLTLLFVVSSFDSVASLLFAVLLGLLATATAVGLWRKRSGRDSGTHSGTIEDITYDPFSDPGQAAKDNWAKAIRRLPNEDDEDD